jgi:hypothetical protein
MRIIAVILATVIGLSIWVPIVAAQEKNWFDFVRKNHVTASERAAFAAFIKSHLEIDEFASLIPTPSPSEQAWLDTELNTDSPSRTLSAMRSLEFKKARARWLIEEIGSLTTLIQRADESEFRYWVILAAYLGDPAVTANVHLYCEGAGISNCPMQQDSSGDGFSISSSVFAKTIVLGVIGPKFGTGFREQN